MVNVNPKYEPVVLFITEGSSPNQKEIDDTVLRIVNLAGYNDIIIKSFRGESHDIVINNLRMKKCNKEELQNIIIKGIKAVAFETVNRGGLFRISESVLHHGKELYGMPREVKLFLKKYQYLRPSCKAGFNQVYNPKRALFPAGKPTQQQIDDKVVEIVGGGGSQLQILGTLECLSHETNGVKFQISKAAIYRCTKVYGVTPEVELFLNYYKMPSCEAEYIQQEIDRAIPEILMTKESETEIKMALESLLQGGYRVSPAMIYRCKTRYEISSEIERVLNPPNFYYDPSTQQMTYVGHTLPTQDAIDGKVIKIIFNIKPENEIRRALESLFEGGFNRVSGHIIDRLKFHHKISFDIELLLTQYRKEVTVDLVPPVLDPVNSSASMYNPTHQQVGVDMYPPVSDPVNSSASMYNPTPLSDPPLTQSEFDEKVIDIDPDEFDRYFDF